MQLYKLKGLWGVQKSGVGAPSSPTSSLRRKMTQPLFLVTVLPNNLVPHFSSLTFTCPQALPTARAALEGSRSHSRMKSQECELPPSQEGIWASPLPPS